MITAPGGGELLLIALVVMLLFGANKLPELARGTGRALRIFKSETRALNKDNDDSRSHRPPSHMHSDADALRTRR